MLKIITCFKWVVDEADIKVDAVSRELVLDRVSFKTSEYDRNAIEEAVRLRELHGASVTAVTVASPTAKPCIKDVLSRGPDKLVFVNDSAFADLEPSQTSGILAAAIKGQGDFDLIICGEGSSDLYSQQVGPALAEKLGIACVTCAHTLTYDEAANCVVAERKLDDVFEVVSAPLPALVTVTPDINTPRIPSLKQILEAARKPVAQVTMADLGRDIAMDFAPRLETLSVLGATTDRKRLRFGAEAEDIRTVVNALLKEGVIA